MKLRDDGKLKVKYSRAEREIFSLLPPRGTKIDTNALIEKRYGDRKPIHARGLILAALRSLAEKADHNEEKFVIRKSERVGPYPISFWIEAR